MTVKSYPNAATISRKNTGPSTDELPSTVAEIGKIHLEGNMLPHEWFNHIKLPSGKTDLAGIIILAEIVYWYRPVKTIDEESGKQVILRKKFKSDMFQSAIGYYEEKFGLTEDQVRKALKRLEDGGFITRQYRDVVQRGMKMTNVTFVEPVPARILEITLPAGAAAGPQGAAAGPLNRDYYKTYGNNPKTTTTTTTTPATTQERQAQNARNESSSSSGSSNNLIFDFSLSNFSQAQRDRAAKTLEELSPEVAQQVLDEFNSAIGSESIKKSQWAWLESVAKHAREGTFRPTSDLAERRQKQTRVTAVQKQRRPSQAWRACLEELRGKIGDGKSALHIMTLRGVEDGEVLWLEAPNAIVADWVKTHLDTIEQVLRPHIQLPIRVCIG